MENKTDNINALIYQHTNYVDVLNSEQHLMNELGLDSLDLIALMMDLEGLFSIVIPDERAEMVRTVGDLHSLVNELTGDV